MTYILEHLNHEDKSVSLANPTVERKLFVAFVGIQRVTCLRA